MTVSRRTLLAGSAAALALLPVGSSSRAATSDCPDTNAPNELVVAAGSPQTAQLGTQFQTNPQVQLANTNGCPLTGQLGGNAVEFAAPSSGVSGTFTNIGSRIAVVGTDAQGLATAPAFTANLTVGSYRVAAQSGYGAANLYLTNTASGLPASITASGSASQQATVNSQYPRPLRARLLDASGQPIEGASVTFTITPSDSGAGASFVGGSTTAGELTDPKGQATSPLFRANRTAGTFTASATTPDGRRPAGYTLENLPAAPETVTAGGAGGESTPTGSPFRVRLAVTVTDKNGNPVSGVNVVFTAPAHGPSGHFTILSTGKRKPARAHTSPTARVTTNSNGIAIAPRFSANTKAGGYIVTGAIKGTSKRAAFALVNQRR